MSKKVDPNWDVAKILAKFSNYMYKEKAYTNSNAGIDNASLEKAFGGANEENFGAIFKSGNKANTYYIAFKGTATKYDAAEDAWATSTKFLPYKKTSERSSKYWQIHNGFYHIYKSFQEDLMGWIFAKIKPTDTIYLTGHSLGGALSTICAYDIDESTKGDGWNWPINYNFASPMVGGVGVPLISGGFVEEYNKRDGNHTTIRIINTRDLVPTLPGSGANYGHVGDYFAMNFCLAEYKSSIPLAPGLLELAVIFLKIAIEDIEDAEGDVLRILANHSMDNYEHALNDGHGSWSGSGGEMVCY